MRQPLIPKGLLIGVGIVIALFIVGTLGYMAEGLSLVDALLATVSAITTVGYSPERPLSASAKVFAVVLILLGVGTGFYVLGRLTEFLVEGGLRGNWYQWKMARQVEDLKDHYIIAGFGRVGQRVASQFEQANVPFVVVDNNPDVIAVAREHDLLHIFGDSTRDETLEIAGVKRARGLVACADSDVNNVYVTLSARALNPELYIVARAGEGDSQAKLFSAGASRVVSPYTMAGNRMAHLVTRPLAADYMDVVVQGQNVGVQIEERRVVEGSSLAQRNVGDIRRHELAGGHVLTVERGDQLIDFVTDDLTLLPDDHIVIVGTSEQLARFDHFAS